MDTETFGVSGFGLDGQPVEKVPETEASPTDSELPEEDNDIDHSVTRVALENELTVLEYCTALHSAISKEGVSKDDVETLQRIAQETFGFQTSIANEMFTPVRSDLNLVVAKESFSKTIIETAKKWLKRLLEYIKQLIAWAKKNFNSYENIKRKIERRAALVKLVENYINDVKRFIVTMPGDILSWAQKQQTQTLESDKLPVNELTLVAFGDASADRKFKGLINDQEKAVDEFLKEVANFQRLATMKSVDSLSDNPSAVAMAITSDHLDAMRQEKASAKYLEEHIGKGFFDHDDRPALKEAFDHSKMFDTYESIRRTLDKLSLDKWQGDTNVLMQQLNEYMTTLSHIRVFAETMYSLNQQRLDALRLRYNFVNEKWVKVYTHAWEEAGSSNTRQSLEAKAAELKQKVADVMK